MSDLNNDISNLITYTPNNNEPIIININGGSNFSPYYSFTDVYNIDITNEINRNFILFLL